MKGLLHRLAARAAGTAAAVRSDARLPFVGGAFVSADSSDVELAPASAAPFSRAQAAPISEAAANGESRPSLPPTQPIAPRPARAMPPHRVEAAPSTPRELVLPTNEVAAPAAATPAALAFELRPSSRSDDAGPTPSPPRSMSIELPAAPAPESSPSLRQAPSEARALPAALLVDEPALLMPRTANPASPSPVPPVPPAPTAHNPLPPSAAAAHAEDGTEVHIHIGRIDVTAVHEAPAARRRPAAAPAPMSLGDYLARRSGS